MAGVDGGAQQVGVEDDEGCAGGDSGGGDAVLEGELAASDRLDVGGVEGGVLRVGVAAHELGAAGDGVASGEPRGERGLPGALGAGEDDDAWARRAQLPVRGGPPHVRVYVALLKNGASVHRGDDRTPPRSSTTARIERRHCTQPIAARTRKTA